MYLSSIEFLKCCICLDFKMVKANLIIALILAAGLLNDVYGFMNMGGVVRAGTGMGKKREMAADRMVIILF